jgi:hypothetical protein
VSELSSQLDLFGLNRLVGLPGETGRLPSSLMLWKEATDLLRLWRDGREFMDPTSSSSFVVVRPGRLLWLTLVGRDEALTASSGLAAMDSKFDMLVEPRRSL